ncbi:MAG: nicotinate (nicotinamide) nucleotide adenylyltransferase [Deltaproteobacteria bacterium]|nr:nicotinate (nicotinamide) nucleotide adenylyltransferase [Deltaproteobacteria bacterium]
MDRSESRRIGIFGGTFNPIHNGHLRVAEEVRQTFALQKLFLVPSSRPPHKGDNEVAAAAHRLAMVRRAQRGNPFFGCSAYECSKGGTSYSAETLAYFAQRFAGAELYFVIGWDAWCDIATWYAFTSLFSLANFIVISRLGAEPWLAGSEGKLFPFALKDEFCYEKDSSYRHISGNSLYFLSVTRLDISSSQIRREAAANRSLRYLVPDGVARYIFSNGLYLA